MSVDSGDGLDLMLINAVRLARNHAKEPTEIADQLAPDFFANLQSDEDRWRIFWRHA